MVALARQFWHHGLSVCEEPSHLAGSPPHLIGYSADPSLRWTWPMLTFLQSIAVVAAMWAPPAATPAVTVSYYKQVRPLFQVHCQGCHQPAKSQGGYIMTSYESLLKAGDRSMAGVVPGQPDKSFLIDQIMPHGDKRGEMPRGADPLLAKDVELIRAWVAQGAKNDTPKNALDSIDAEHPPTYVLPPVITSLEYSPDGTTLASNGFHEVFLFSAADGKPQARLIGLSEQVQSVSYSPDGKFLAVSGGSPGRFGEIQIWDIAKRKLKVAAPFTGDTLYGVSWSPDGKLVAFGGADNNLRAIDSTTGKQVLFQGAHNDWVLGTSFGRDGKYLISVSRDRTLKLTDVTTQRFIDNVTSITPGALKGGLQVALVRPGAERKMFKAASIAVGSTDEKLFEELLIGGADGIPRLYKMHRETKRVIGDDANKIREYAALLGRINAAVFSPDGARFAVGSSLDGVGMVRVYQTADAKQVSQFEGALPSVYALTWKPDGSAVAVGGFDGTVRQFDPNTGKLKSQFVVAPATVTAAR